MSILLKSNSTLLDWIDIEFLPNSSANKKEIYVKSPIDKGHDLLIMFNRLFKNISDDIVIYNEYWWNFCLDVWNIHNNKYDYSFTNKSEFTRAYLSMLNQSNIERNYCGNCLCNNFDEFIRIILDCLIHHIAPYSPLFYSKKWNLFFYFHHTGSMGLYFKEKNIVIDNIIYNAKKYYDLI